MMNLLIAWNVVLTAMIAFGAAIMLRHRRALINMDRREERVREEMLNLARILMDGGLHRRVAELRERWSAEAPMGDAELQAKCLRFLEEIESASRGEKE